MSERQEGWYWVKWLNDTSEPSWCPSWWCVVNESWWVEECYQCCADVQEIGPRIPTPDEPWQCVPVEPTLDMLEFSAIGGEDEIYVATIYGSLLAAAPKP